MSKERSVDQDSAKNKELENVPVLNRISIKNSPFSDVVYKELSKLNGQINKMSRAAVTEKLKKWELSTEGSTEVLKKRLKNYHKQHKLSKANLLAVSKLHPYYVIIDYEATCQEVNGPDFVHEIIEFPAVLVSVETLEIVDTFQEYCKPTLAPTLTEFCTELTGIIQDQIDIALPFPKVFENFQGWLKKHKLGSKHSFAIVTDGPWDMGRFLGLQCKLSNVKYPSFAKKWINIRKAFSNFYKSRRFSLSLMLEHLGMEFEGRPHCGLDDARNIARVLIRMISDGASVQVNERIYWRGEQTHVASLNPVEKIRDIHQVQRKRNTMKDLSIFELSETDTSGEDSIDKDLTQKLNQVAIADSR